MLSENIYDMCLSYICSVNTSSKDADVK